MEYWWDKSLCESLNSRDWEDPSAIKAFAALAETAFGSKRPHWQLTTLLNYSSDSLALSSGLNGNFTHVVHKHTFI